MMTVCKLQCYEIGGVTQLVTAIEIKINAVLLIEATTYYCSGVTYVGI